MAYGTNGSFGSDVWIDNYLYANNATNSTGGLSSQATAPVHFVGGAIGFTSSGASAPNAGGEANGYNVILKKARVNTGGVVTTPLSQAGRYLLSYNENNTNGHCAALRRLRGGRFNIHSRLFDRDLCVDGHHPEVSAWNNAVRDCNRCS